MPSWSAQWSQAPLSPAGSGRGQKRQLSATPLQRMREAAPAADGGGVGRAGVRHPPAPTFRPRWLPAPVRERLSCGTRSDHGTFAVTWLFSPDQGSSRRHVTQPFRQRHRERSQVTSHNVAYILSAYTASHRTMFGNGWKWRQDEVKSPAHLCKTS